MKNLETKSQETEKAKRALSKMVQQQKASQDRQASDMESLKNWVEGQLNPKGRAYVGARLPRKIILREFVEAAMNTDQPGDDSDKASENFDKGQQESAAAADDQGNCQEVQDRPAMRQEGPIRMNDVEMSNGKTVAAVSAALIPTAVINPATEAVGAATASIATEALGNAAAANIVEGGGTVPAVAMGNAAAANIVEDGGALPAVAILANGDIEGRLGLGLEDEPIAGITKDQEDSMSDLSSVPSEKPPTNKKRKAENTPAAEKPRSKRRRGNNQKGNQEHPPAAAGPSRKSSRKPNKS